MISTIFDLIATSKYNYFCGLSSTQKNQNVLNKTVRMFFTVMAISQQKLYKILKQSLVEITLSTRKIKQGTPWCHKTSEFAKLPATIL